MNKYYLAFLTKKFYISSTIKTWLHT